MKRIPRSAIAALFMLAQACTQGGASPDTPGTGQISSAVTVTNVTTYQCQIAGGKAGPAFRKCMQATVGGVPKKDHCDATCPLSGSSPFTSPPLWEGLMIDLMRANKKHAKVVSDDLDGFFDDMYAALKDRYPVSWAIADNADGSWGLMLTYFKIVSSSIRSVVRNELFTVANAQRTLTGTATDIDTQYGETCGGLDATPGVASWASARDKLTYNAPATVHAPAGYFPVPVQYSGKLHTDPFDGLSLADSGGIPDERAFGVASGRLSSEYRELARSVSNDSDAWLELCLAVKDYQRGSNGPFGGANYCPGADRARARADLLVTGKRSYRALLTFIANKYGNDHAGKIALLNDLFDYAWDTYDLASTTLCPNPMSKFDTLDAVKAVVNRVYNVANIIDHGYTDPAARAALGYIAVSSEDDVARRPTNVTSAPYAQYNLTVPVPRAGKPAGSGNAINVSMRYFLADGEPLHKYVSGAPPEGGWDTLPTPSGMLNENYVGNQLPASLFAGKEVILFLHGLGSRAEEADEFAQALHDKDPQHKYVVLTMDLPNQGYSDRVHPEFDVAHLYDSGQKEPFALGFAVFPMFQATLEGADENGPKHVPFLRFQEDAVVAFVDTLDAVLGGNRILKSKIRAVAGGSLGGNLGLRLGRRALDWGSGSTSERWGHANTAQSRVIAWSPGSAWESLADAHDVWGFYLDPKRIGITKSFDDAMGDGCNFYEVNSAQWLQAGCSTKEPAQRRGEFINAKFFAHTAEVGVAIVPPGPGTWYRWDWPCLMSAWVADALNVQEQYDPLYRIAIKRLEFEQLLYSHFREHDAAGNDYSPISTNKVPTVWLTGGGDDFPFAMIYDASQTDANLTNKLPGRLLRLGKPGADLGSFTAEPQENTGHSIADERPKLLGYVVQKNLAHSKY